VLKCLPAAPRYFFLTRAGLADKVDFFCFFLPVTTDFFNPPDFDVLFEEGGRPFLGFRGESLELFVFPLNFWSTSDFFFSSWSEMAGVGLAMVSDDSFEILTIFFPALLIPLPEDPVEGGKGNVGSFFFFRASPEKTRT
jgi:hypothetical protein